MVVERQVQAQRLHVDQPVDLVAELFPPVRPAPTRVRSKNCADHPEGGDSQGRRSNGKPIPAR